MTLPGRWPRSRPGWALVAGVPVMVLACVWPLLPAYLLGLAAAAFGLAGLIAARLRSRRRALAAGSLVVLVTVALGVLVPAGLARSVTNADVAWRVDAGQVVTTDRGVFIHREGSVSAADPVTGEERWQVPTGWGQTVVSSDGGLVVDEDDPSQFRRYDADGELRWGPLVPGGVERVRAAAATDDTVVFYACTDDEFTPSRCTVLGIDGDGTERWRRTFQQSAVTYRKLLADVLPEAFAIRLDHGRGPDELLVLDPDTGDTLRSERVPDGNMYAAVVPHRDRIVAATRAEGDRCRWDAYEGSTRVWRFRFDGGCWSGAGQASIISLFADRMYVRVSDAESGQHAVLTIDLESGEGRILDRRELHDLDAPWESLGGSYTLHRGEDRIVVFDAASGEQLWTRETGLEEWEVELGEGLLIQEPTRVPNPFLRSVLGDSGRLVLLDPRTGTEVATAVTGDIEGGVEPFRRYAGVGLNEGGALMLGSPE